MAEIVSTYLDLLDSQREELFAQVETVPAEQIWARPAPGNWSPGEQLDHIRRFNRFVTRLFRVAWPLLWPVARIRRKRRYEVEIDNVYLRPKMPMNVGVLWSPVYSQERPASLAQLHDALAREHLGIRSWFESKDERLLGNAYVWDPPIGWFNLIQGLRIVAYHDAYHYAAVHRILDI